MQSLPHILTLIDIPSLKNTSSVWLKKWDEEDDNLVSEEVLILGPLDEQSNPILKDENDEKSSKPKS